MNQATQETNYKTTEDIISKLLQKHGENDEGYKVPKVIATKTCEKCGNEKTVLETEDGIIEYCFSVQCDDRMKVLKPKWQRKRDFYWSFSKVPLSLKNANFDNFNQKDNNTKLAYQGCNYYAHEVSNDNPIRLLIHGSNGTGKSHLAISVLRSISNQPGNKMTCLFISQQEILELIQASWSDKHEHDQSYYYKVFEEVDLLVIDDFGISFKSDFSIGVMTNIINKRSGKPLIITTNLSSKQLSSEASLARLNSKLKENAHIIELVSDDYRQRNTQHIKPLKTEQMNIGMVQEQNSKVPYDLDNPPF